MEFAQNAHHDFCWVISTRASHGFLHLFFGQNLHCVRGEENQRPDPMVVIATVNLFSVVSSDEDQFRPPKTVKLGHEWEGGREGKFSRRGTSQCFRSVEGVQVGAFKRSALKGLKGKAARTIMLYKKNVTVPRTYNSQDSHVVTHHTTNGRRVAYVRQIVGWLSPG